MKIGNKMKDALEFCERNPGGWHSFSRDSNTRKIIARLCALGLIEVNEFYQFRKVSMG